MNTIQKLRDSYETGDVVTIDIVDLLRNLDGSCDVGNDIAWVESMFMEKVLDNEIGYLIESLLENGQTVPLNIIGYGSGFEMGNGHHRLCAMLLSGFDTVDVVVDECMDFAGSEDDSLDKSYSDEADESFSSLYPWLLDVYYSAVFAKEMA